MAGEIARLGQMRDERAEHFTVRRQKRRCLHSAIARISCKRAIGFVFRILVYVGNDYPFASANRPCAGQASIDRHCADRPEESGVESAVRNYLERVAGS